MLVIPALRANQTHAVNQFNTIKKDQPLAKPNYQFEKRQKEIEKKKKKEKKSQRKQDKEAALPMSSLGERSEGEKDPLASASEDLE